MKLLRTSMVVRWAYLLDPEKIPAATNVCDLFWRSIMMIPFSIISLCIILAFGPFFFVLWLMEEWIGPAMDASDTIQTFKNSFRAVIIQRFKDWKNRRCTMIEIE